MDGTGAPIPARVERASATAVGDRILLVDDDPVVRLLTASALAERGWRIVEADSGVAALDAFQRARPDVVVLDALMPGIDGFATCERLRRLPGGAHVPVLMLTGLEDESSIARAYEAGATDFFVKSGGQWTLLSERLRYMLRSARTRDELAQSQARLSKAQRMAQLGHWEWDLAARRVRMSEECFKVLGIPSQESVADWYVWSRLAADDRAAVRQQYLLARHGSSHFNLECRVERPSGEPRVVRVEAEVQRADDGAVATLHGVVRDITEARRSEDQIRLLANYDSLTGLPNRRHFRERFAEAIERARESGTGLALFYVDVDRFKQINDTLGHDIGDQLLREIAQRLKTAAEGIPGRPSDDASRALVARVGGDEFNVMLAGLADPEAAQGAARTLVEALQRPIVCAGNELFATASIGVACFPDDGHDVDALVRKADIAMYAAKDQGRNGWLAFDDSMNKVTAERWRLETALHRALERGELVLYYQPQVDGATGRIIGAEALMRWRREGRLVPPVEFIAAAEESGLIVPITEWAIGEACAQLDDWVRHGARDVSVAVNISSRHMQRGKLDQSVRAALAQYAIAPGMLELELTETVLMHNLDAAQQLLQRLKQLGVSISIDDFGTGYSSLAYLRRLPIDTLKIDRTFVRDLETSPDSQAIVAAIIALCNSLKLRPVAEGVESEGQRARLLEQGCRTMQGFLFARPLPADEFRRLLLAQDAPAARPAPGGAAAVAASRSHG
ncbi:MAG TPA: EAL domain-containing protein [Burkholderiaceae bacterium]|nr:EAL domain-containing protein [Burkholderiaceae bacterium]